uniref:Tyrosine-protein phosphatase non-receptor type 9 n=1 Tax=Oncorhynchus kisutch TaxID=8019 RepID=A0A8C7LHB4_ONCKI
MAEALTSQEELAVEEFLSEVRSREHPHSAALVSQPTAVKFLMARKFDVSRAIDLFQAYKNTRIKEGIFNINPEEEPLRSELLSGKFTVLPGRDAKGAALALFTARLHRSDVTTHRAVLQAIIFQLDKAIESVDTQRDGLIFIYDMTNSSYGNFDYELCVKILDLLKGAFPARLKCVFIVSSPLWFRAPFAVLRLFVREKLRERVCTVKAHELSNYIPVSSLPEHLDGTSRYSHVAWIQSCVNTHAAPGDASTHPHDTHDCVGSLLLSYSLEPHNANAAATLAATQTSIDSHSDSPLHGASPNANSVNGRQPPPQSDTPPDTPLHHKVVGITMSDPCPQEEVSVHMPDGVGMNVLELVEHVKKRKKKGIYQSMKRYAGTSDYINASLMDGYKRSNAYIATQGPLPKTFGDFWRMVWEQMVLIVVMTTRVVERGRVKCGQYWPKEEGTTEQHGHFLVRNTSIQLYQDFRLSHLELYNSQTGERREVSHYLYVSWPDFGVPKCALAMLDFREHVQQRQEAALRSLGAEWVGPPGGPPLVVHCSAGIGRTGTFCTLDICLSRLEDIGTVDVCETVRRMRTQRAFSIQTWDQYYFCYTAVIEYAQRRGKLTPVQWSDSDLETDSE